MTRFRTILYVALMGFAATAVAHPNHDEDEAMTSERAAKLADQSLPALVQSKKLKAAWLKGERQEAVKRNAGGREVWVVAYKAPAGAAGASEGSLYLFFDDLGNFIDANHTGSLPSK